MTTHGIDLVLVLVHLSHDLYDIAGNKYPKDSGFVCADSYTKDQDIRNGLSGILWGKSEYLSSREQEHDYWGVVKTQRDDFLKYIDRYHNIVKFHNGFLLHFGTINSCANFILEEAKDPSHYFEDEASTLQPKDIVGTKEWLAYFNQMYRDFLS